MKSLIRELIPNAPKLGLYTAPDIPGDKLQNAMRDYARGVKKDEVLALYDGTLMGNATDGAVFTADRMVFQNNPLDPVQEIRYVDIVGVESKRRLLGGRAVIVDVNRGRAMISLTVDFSEKPKAGEFVARFLEEAMVRSVAQELEEKRNTPGETDIEAVRDALDGLRERGELSERDFRRLMQVLRG